jgi:DNA modification methylase
VSFDNLYPGLGRIELGDGLDRRRRKRPILAPTVGTRSSPAFNAHSYHTKIPPEAIEPYITHYTRPGAVILDPFAGSGMSGVAARRLGRQAVLSDLSPAAAHIGWNMTHWADANEVGDAARRVWAAVGAFLDDVYTTTCSCGDQARLAYTIWSDRLACPNCSEPMNVWDELTDHKSGRLGDYVECPSCRTIARRRGLRRIDRQPAWVALDCGRCGRVERAAHEADRAEATSWSSRPVSSWYPTESVDASREMYIRSALGLQGIQTVADFYTPRNLHALSSIWSAVRSEPDVRLRQAMAFAFTNTAWHGTIMRRYNARGGQRPLTGTLYIPHLSSEVNVWNVFAHKIKQLQRFYSTEWANGSREDHVSIAVTSATDLMAIPDRSIDYCFTDPPFGSNIFYADCNLIWESWLGSVTDATEEAVVNRSRDRGRGGKGIDDYSELMQRSFSEIARVLRPDAAVTVVFHSTDAAIWQALEDSARVARLDIVGASHMDKTQLSHKGYRGRSGGEDVAAFDVVLAMRNRQPRARTRSRQRAAVAVLTDHLNKLKPIGENDADDRKRTLPYLHSLLVQHHFNGDIGLEIGDFEVVRSLCSGNFTEPSPGIWAVD